MLFFQLIPVDSTFPMWSFHADPNSIDLLYFVVSLAFYWAGVYSLSVQHEAQGIVQVDFSVFPWFYPVQDFKDIRGKDISSQAIVGLVVFRCFVQFLYVVNAYESIIGTLVSFQDIYGHHFFFHQWLTAYNGCSCFFLYHLIRLYGYLYRIVFMPSLRLWFLSKW